MPQAVGFDVVFAYDYAAQLAKLIPAAKKRIVIAAMVVRAGNVSTHLLQLCVDAARRGVAVHVVADVFCQHGSNRPNDISRHQFRQECAQTRELLNEMHALGGTVDWVGRIGLNPYAGRYHAKATIIDDDVFGFGGVNFCDDGFQNTDYMLHVKNKDVAARLYDVVGNAPTANLEVPLGQHDTLLYDGGQKGNSIIYDRACKLAAASKKVTFISQMCPTGRLADALKSTQSVCYFNQPTKTGFAPSALAQLWDNWRTGIHNHYEGDAYIHAKCILFELKDGSKAVLSGSHNFSWRGVAFGTKEITLQSSDPALWLKLQNLVYAVATDAGTR